MVSFKLRWKGGYPDVAGAQRLKCLRTGPFGDVVRVHTHGYTHRRDENPDTY